jgi:transposase InsO family protein
LLKVLRKHQHPGVVPITTAAPNDLSTADFKGQFRTGNGVHCFPLTIADQRTRFLLECHGLLTAEATAARPVFGRVFREYGAPVAIRTDNGVPFATIATHRLSYLNVWWMRLGIIHQRMRPGCSQENGMAGSADGVGADRAGVGEETNDERPPTTISAALLDNPRYVRLVRLTMIA